MANAVAVEETSANLVFPDTLLKHWQEHRRLTRRTIEAFPEDKLFEFSIGGMRPFGAMAAEMIGMVLPTVDGLTTGDWDSYKPAKPETKAEVLRAWDEVTEGLDDRFPQIPLSHFSQIHKAFGQWEMPGLALIQYVIDNEIHHRGQGYVYLRALGIAPPAFWDRS